MSTDELTILLSAGIDIGTTTTHITLSRLGIANGEAAHRVPRLNVCSREIIYQSPIFFTPLNADGAIDGDAVSALIRREYESAGVSAAQIASGAAIITGEPARLRNAPEVVQKLARFAGDFVVASAGINLESVLAGKGSGAAQYSKDHLKTICNVDIGGGTTNIAVFFAGKLIDTACVGIGGRCIKFDNNERVVALTESGETFFDAVAKLRYIEIGEKLSEENLELFGALLAEAILHAVLSNDPPQVSQRLLLTDALTQNYHIDEFWFSGGVAELMVSPPQDALAYGDMGVYLARGLLGALHDRQLKWFIPEHPVRATVIGAGMHTMQLSGSTVSINTNRLPLRNIPVLKIPNWGELALQPEAILTIKSILSQSESDWSKSPLALSLEQQTAPSYESLKKQASTICELYRACDASPPLVVLTNRDIALATGQLIRELYPELEAVILDGIATEDGDFLDIGNRLANAQTVPVVVKTLVFRQ